MKNAGVGRGIAGIHLAIGFNLRNGLQSRSGKSGGGRGGGLGFRVVYGTQSIEGKQRKRKLSSSFWHFAATANHLNRDRITRQGQTHLHLVSIDAGRVKIILRLRRCLVYCGLMLTAYRSSFTLRFWYFT